VFGVQLVSMITTWILVFVATVLFLIFKAYVRGLLD
jgi:hypothetical protein